MATDMTIRGWLTSASILGLVIGIGWWWYRRWAEADVIFSGTVSTQWQREHLKNTSDDFRGQ